MGIKTAFIAAAIITLPVVSFGQAVDHFELTAPGFRNGNHPYTLYAGDCYALTVQAKDGSGQVVTSYNGNVVITQWAINDQTGSPTEPRFGISKYSDIIGGNHLGRSSITVTMSNGEYVFGAGGDLSTRICFYYATRAPQDYKQSGGHGDFVLAASTLAVQGVSLSYVVWHNTPQKIILLAPNQTLNPATSAGCSTDTVISEKLGAPFMVKTHLVDQFYNQIIKDSSINDTVQLTASHPTSISFFPSQAQMTNGILSSVVTITSSAVCDTTVTLTATDINAVGPNFLSSDSEQVYIEPFGGGGGPGPDEQNPGFYLLSVPGIITAGSTFTMTVIVNNVDLTALGDLQYTGTLTPMLAITESQFIPAPGTLGIPTFNFPILSGFKGNHLQEILSQSYTIAQTVWIQLVGGSSPPELENSSVLGGPILVLAGDASKLQASASPTTLGALSISRISLALTDDFGNGIAGKVLTVQIIEGASGTLSAGGTPGTFVQVLTNASGQAALDFLSGTISEDFTIRVSAPAEFGIPSKELSILVSLLGGKTVAAYPSPVMITQRPLTIEYHLNQNSDVTISIVDLFGQAVWTRSIPAGSQGGLAGYNRVLWAGKNGIGRIVAVGVYALHLEINANGQISRAKTRFGIRK